MISDLQDIDFEVPEELTDSSDEAKELAEVENKDSWEKLTEDEKKDAVQEVVETRRNEIDETLQNILDNVTGISYAGS